jgi:membrane associated rhomboid family serine protease
LWFPIRIPAWFYLGGWFLYQFFESNYSLVHRPTGDGGGVAFFAHVGGFIFGVIAAWALVSTGRIAAQENTSNAT